jgi:hypothetical protein
VLATSTRAREAGQEVADDPNINADLAIFVLSR